jgi:hypothetical protein
MATDQALGIRDATVNGLMAINWLKSPSYLQ